MIPAEYKESLKALEKATDAIDSARYNLKGEFYGVTANRTYYACYYCLIALLYTQKVYSKTHPLAQTDSPVGYLISNLYPIPYSDRI
jgi:uncharacterized protein (UPF0332 family)